MDVSCMLKSCISIAVAGGVTVFLFVIILYSRSDLFQCGFPKTNRRFLFSVEGGVGSMDRIIGECASKENIYISQGQTPPLPSGIPTYTVEIQNICIPSAATSCRISDIHITCGWFSSARLINPNVFKRISFNDCLVNNGNPINPGQTIIFQYANTYPYPMYVSSLSCN